MYIKNNPHDKEKINDHMKIVVTGGTGLIGEALVAQLVANGDSVSVLTRDASKARKILPLDVAVFQWNPESDNPPLECLEGSDAIVNLIGEPIKGRWTKAKKLLIRRSRTVSIRNLAAVLTTMDNPPLRFVSASAVGYYGDRGDDELTETSGPGEGFLSEVVQAWEDGLEPLRDAGFSITPLRLGLVLSNHGGVLRQLLFPWLLGLGVKIGNGSQWWPWIHIEDAVALIDHALKGRMPIGPVNAVAPEPVTQLEFANILAKVLNRPRMFRLPRFVIQCLLGEMAFELTASRKAVASDSGYEFRFPTLDLALQDLLLTGSAKRNGLRRYQTEMSVNAAIYEVFDFFSDPANLEQITPPWLKFEMITPQPLTIGFGTIINYRLRLHRIPITWQSEITEWNPPQRFVDVQNKGPYSYWSHTHEFKELEGRTVVRDTVYYAVPGGSIVDRLFVRNDLDRIFMYRQCKLRELFSKKAADN